MRIRAIVLALAVLVLAAGLSIDRRSTLAAYLVAWVAIGAIPLGALGTLMTSYLVRRAWTERLHPILTAATATLPLVALLFLPVLIGMKEIYPAASDFRTLPAFKALYLAPWFFVVRTIVYFIVIWLVALWQKAAWGNTERMMRSASAGLIIYALLISFAGIDWVESLEPEFHSSIYGLLYLWFTLLDGTAFGIGAALLLGRRIGATRGYSALLLSTILLWTYLHAMQYIVIWSGDIPDEVIWYIKRSERGWQFVLIAVAVGQFVFPFFALLSAGVRADARWLLALSALTLVMRICEAALLILPAIEGLAPLATAVMLIAAVAFLGTILYASFAAALGLAALRVSPPARDVQSGAGRQSREQAPLS
jgi:hypothetical protein